ncbi:unnamed protein product [Periconia digitata]|uniref:Uncharacterized protein n=1 Tax=Periconia digitata TaxID=1303443 RepID=A0A9W4XDE8_9PLEO|nr:unnamed protein product [Periconia digitata]
MSNNVIPSVLAVLVAPSMKGWFSDKKGRKDSESLFIVFQNTSRSRSTLPNCSESDQTQSTPNNNNIMLPIFISPFPCVPD